MKVITFGKNKEAIDSLVKENGFEIVKTKPDFVISFGGDGTFMHSESQFPGIPKIILKGSHVCKLCSPLDNKVVLEKIASKNYKVEEHIKITTNHKGNKLSAVNDITVHNGDPRHAIRYELLIDGKKIGSEIIGDGIVVATPLGSTGYYRSITDSFFETGIGLAFNNSTEQSDHIVLDGNSKIEVLIKRGPAVVFADNQKKTIELKEGDKILIEKSKEIAKIIRPK